MPNKLIDRLLFAQGNNCFFCQRPLPPAHASVEHLVARANGGSNDPDNTVACCKSLNSLLGHMSLKEKLRVILNQKGQFICPKDDDAATGTSDNQTGAQRFQLVVADLRKRGASCPRTLKSLRSTINALFQKKLSVQEVESLVGKLRARGFISISDTKVAYTLPPIVA